MAVQVTELPNGGICPSAAVILFGFTFQFEEMRTQIVTVSQISHDVEKPITHPAWEIGHLISSALLREIKNVSF